jgi:HD-GYP domain-containing protein (c-di-GMP phosphodiesterase class II)
MRLLDYDGLYRKRDPAPEELAFLREHPSVGAAMVEPLLGVEIARAVLCHHERVDGRGYPNELKGDEIPLLSRIVQICDAWVAMTDPGTYQPAQSRENALSTMTRGAGSQFDAGLVTRFVDMMRSQ